MTVSDNLLAENINDYEIDQLDLNIIKLLQQNGRIAYSDIARSIDAPEATIRYRVKRLIDEKIISISAFINTGKIKYENVAHIDLEVTPIFLEANINELIAMENISYAASVTGAFDIMLEYIYGDNDELLNFIHSLKRNPNVRRLNSRTVLKIYKAQYPARIQP